MDVLFGVLAPFGQGVCSAAVLVPPGRVSRRGVEQVPVRIELLPKLQRAVHGLEEVAAREKVVGRIAVGRDEIWVGTHEFRDELYAYLRRYYKDKKNGEWKPTKKGVNVPIALLPELVKLTDQLAEMAAQVER